MKNGWFLILFLGALVLNFSCNGNSGCGDVDYQGNQREIRKQMVVEINCSDSIFFNYDFTFNSLVPEIKVKDNFFSLSSNYLYINGKERIGLIPLPADRNEWKILVKHKSKGSDTLTIVYSVDAIAWAGHSCSEPSFVNRAKVWTCSSTGNVFKVLSFKMLY